MKRRILFVDDETMVTSGLQRMLRSMRDQWDMEFANDGAEALSKMERSPFDLVVSDMRMPGMNGAQLLKETARRFPQTIRFILSGQADNELIMQCVGTAHQFLAKPCDPEKLKTAVARTLAVSDVLNCSALKNVVSQLNTIPSLPSLYSEIMAEINSADSSIDSVGMIIARDPGMTAKILQLVNSAFFGLQRQISNPAEAAMLLGLETIKSLVLWIQVFSQFPQELPAFSIDSLSSHSLATGLLARETAKMQDADTTMRDQAMTAGLLHDLGKLILAANKPEIFTEAIAVARSKDVALYQAEREVIGTSHAEIGAYLLGLWGLPFEIVEAVAMHHSPSNCGNRVFSPLTSVHVANAIQNSQHPPTEYKTTEIDQAYIAELGISEQIEAWQKLSGDTERVNKGSRGADSRAA